MEFKVQPQFLNAAGNTKIQAECPELDEADIVYTESTKRFDCLMCHKMIVKRHQWDHEKICGVTLEKIHKCPFDGCEQVFAISGYLTTHISRVHKDPKINCPYQDCRTVCKKYRLLRHIKDIHDGQKRVGHKIKCETCGKSVVNIWGHRIRCNARMLEEKSVECNYENCKALFKTNGGRQSHVKSVHQSPIGCPVKKCSSVIKPMSLARHMRTVHRKST